MSVAKHWRMKAQRYRLEGTLCQSCGQAIFLPRPLCPHCRGGIAVAITAAPLPEPAIAEGAMPAWSPPEMQRRRG